MNYQNYAHIDCKAPDGTLARIWVGICNVMDDGRYHKYIWEAQEHVAKKYAKTKTVTEDGEEVEDSPSTAVDFWSDRRTELIALQDRAAMLACFRLYEVMGEDGDYHEATIPAEWVNVETFATELSNAVYRDWKQHTIFLNPQFFNAALTDDQKKGWNVTVGYSTSLPGR